MTTHCYFLVYRRYSDCRKKIRWREPTGGMVMAPGSFYQGVPVSDWTLALSVIEQRYHRGPNEELIVVEVFSRKEKRLAQQLHDQWEQEAAEFMELMTIS